MKERLQFSQKVKEFLMQSSNLSEIFPTLYTDNLEQYKNGHFYILPSFMKMLLWLKKAKRVFRVVFRSSGREIPNVVSEFNLFCEGGHPAFNG
jgi:hypothetical protein